jgi:type IV fimbrial biogenesis protein FimT
MNQALYNNPSPLCRRVGGPALKRTSGVTLIELMVTISIVGILMAIGVPSYKYVTNANRVASEVNGLLGDMQFARAEAIKEGRTVTVCTSTNGTSCDTGVSNTGWQEGWIVFSDPTNIGTRDNTETIWRVQGPFKAADTFTNNATNTVTFNRAGFAPAANALTITLHDKTSNSKWTRCLNISTVGMLTTQPYGGQCT